MAKYKFVTEASVFGDTTAEVDILSAADVERIAGRVTDREVRELADSATRELRKMSARVDEVQSSAEEMGKKAVAAGEMAAKSRADRIVANAKESFRAIVRESLAPILESGLGQTLDNQKTIQAEHKALKTATAGLELKVATLEARMAAVAEDNKRLKAEIAAIQDSSGETGNGNARKRPSVRWPVLGTLIAGFVLSSWICFGLGRKSVATAAENGRSANLPGTVELDARQADAPDASGPAEETPDRLLARARAGDEEAQIALGKLLLDDRPVDGTDEESLRWAGLAARHGAKGFPEWVTSQAGNGNAWVQFFLGRRAEQTGRIQEAGEWYRKASEGGNIHAKRTLEHFGLEE